MTRGNTVFLKKADYLRRECEMWYLRETGMTMREIGEIHRVTVERVRQILAKHEERMRAENQLT